MSEIQFIIFKLGQEEYGVNIVQVQEIGDYAEPVHVPNTPDFVEGVMNLRGEIIPIVNLKKKFNLPVEELTENARTMVINVGSKRIGFTVDDASEVLALDESSIDPAPEIIVGNDKKYIVGIGKLKDRILIMLDLNALFSNDEKQQIEALE